MDAPGSGEGATPEPSSPGARLFRIGTIIAATAPAALLILTLGQQVAAGSGFEVASSFVSGIGSERVA
jgi:hypothetical protein